MLPAVLLSKPLNDLINKRNTHDPKTDGGHSPDLHVAGDLVQDLESKAAYKTGGVQLAPAAANAHRGEEESMRAMSALKVGRKKDRKGQRRKDTLTHARDRDLDQDQSPKKGGESEPFHTGLPQDQGIEMI